MSQSRALTVKNVFNNGKIIPESCREPFVLPTQYPACMHDPTPSNGTSRLRSDLELTYRSPTERIRDFLVRCLSTK